jgi:hypothetical protein
MEVRQRRDSNRAGYVFGDDELRYSWEDGAGNRSLPEANTDISRDRQALTERNAWLRNTGLLTAKGNLLAISGDDGCLILTEIEFRRAGQLRREYDLMPEGGTD